jgi:predicted nucleotide-binding protein
MAKNALIGIYRKVHDCSFEQAQQAISDVEYADQLYDYIKEKPQHLLGLAKGLSIFTDAKNSDKNKNNALSKPDPRKIFVVHGRNKKIRDALFMFLRALKLEPIEWSEAIKLSGKGSPYVGEILDIALSMSQAITVLLTPDDEVKLKKVFVSENDPVYEKKMTGQARPNVLFEAGMAFGKNPHKTILVQVGAIKPFSDIGGRHIIKLDNSSIQRQEVANRLKTAGCAVSLDGKDWLSIGDFQI